ncbi:MAG: serine/threonine-protein kinase, partial [Myxococcota bacterium]
MSQRFIRCHHCGLPHNLTDEVCPITGKPIRRRRKQPVEGTEREDQGRHAMPIPLVSPRAAKSRPAWQGEGDHRLVGRIIGEKYRVHSLIGEGGMGTVYEAEHLQIGRRVAIKVLNRAHLGRKEAVARFHQEARAAGAIGHPNICEIYDVGRLDDGSPYLVMERLHGKTLADRINIEGALPFEDVITILTQVLSALVAAHEKGIIHRDIKPENIFLAERVGCAPVVKILDFGISKSADDSDLSLTRTGMVMGTPFYMAPEQARGEHIDHRVDIYACGVILYEALTGRRPFIASNYNALVVQVLSAQPRDPRELRPAIPSAFV